MNKVIYAGIFYPSMGGSLANVVSDQHTTLKFRPSEDEMAALRPFIGKEIEVTVKGYGNNLINEGLLVELPANIPFYGSLPHVTLSLAEGARAVDTAKISFDKDLPEGMPTKFVGKIGCFMSDGKVHYDAD